jgi:hypothetical protein
MCWARSASSLRGALATKQSNFCVIGQMDCFAALAMTALEHRCRKLSSVTAA